MVAARADVTHLNERQLKTLHRLKTNKREYSKYCLKVKSKNMGLIPLEWNRVQDYIHSECEDQLRRKGWVRKIIVKGRQQTCSTGVASMYYHEAQFTPGTDVYILSHESKSTAGLFDKVDVFNTEMKKNWPQLVHATVDDNKKELSFSNLSKYGVGTAGEGETGRGLTARCFHGSECAFWAEADKIRKGVLQTIGLLPNTWVILESTCNGLNWWYTFVMSALAGKGVYEVIFIPWFWTAEYQLPIDDTFVPTKEELALLETYKSKGLTTYEQLNWRRAKIEELGSLKAFKQEYPNNLTEAFQASGDAFYDSDLVERAFTVRIMRPDPVAPLILGVDVGRRGDRTTLVYRRGRVIEKVRIFRSMTTTRLAGLIAEAIDGENVDYVFIDKALGIGAIDVLEDRGYGGLVEGIDFGQSPIDEQYANKRAEMACLFGYWLEDVVSIVAEDEQQKMEIAADIGMMPEFKLTANSRKQFPSKEELKKEYKRSPDCLDGIMLTFGGPVASKSSKVKVESQTANTARGSSLSARRRVAEGVNQTSDPYSVNLVIENVTPQRAFRRYR